MIVHSAAATRRILLDLMNETSNQNARVIAGHANHASYSPDEAVEMGILDPTKVTRSALQYAASVAGLAILTEAAIAEKPSKGDAHADPGAGGPMGGMGGMDY